MYGLLPSSRLLEKQTFLWRSPPSLALDVIDPAAISVSIHRLLPADTASVSAQEEAAASQAGLAAAPDGGSPRQRPQPHPYPAGADSLRLTYTIVGRPDWSAPSTPIGTVSQAMTASGVTFSLRTPSSVAGRVLGSPYTLAIEIWIPDSCQAGLSLSIRGSDRGCSVDFADDFPAAFGDLALSFVPFYFSPMWSAAGSRVTAKSLSVRSVVWMCAKHDVAVGDLTAVLGVTVETCPGTVAVGSVVAGDGSVAIVAKEEGSVTVGAVTVFGGDVQIASAKGDVACESVSHARSLAIRADAGSIYIGQGATVERVASLEASGGVAVIMALAAAEVVMTSATGTIRSGSIHAERLSIDAGDANVDVDTLHASMDLTIKSNKGDITTTKMIGAAPVYLKSVSGGIRSTMVACETLLIDTGSGGVQIDAIECDQDARIESVSGSTLCKDIVVGGDLQLNSVAGNMDLADMTVREKIYIESLSGHFRADTVWARSLSHASKSGNCTIGKLHIADMLNVDVVTGTISLPDTVFVGDCDAVKSKRIGTVATVSGGLSGTFSDYIGLITSSMARDDVVCLDLKPLDGSATDIKTAGSTVVRVNSPHYSGDCHLMTENGTVAVTRAGKRLSHHGTDLHTFKGHIGSRFDVDTTMTIKSLTNGDIQVDFA